MLQEETINFLSTDLLSRISKVALQLNNRLEIDRTDKQTFSSEHKCLHTWKGHALNLESAHRHNGHTKEIVISRCCLRLEGVRPQPKQQKFCKTCWGKSKCKCLGKRTGARTLRSNGTATRDWYAANLLFVSCGLNPLASLLHVVRNLCLRSSANSWLEMEEPCRTACTNDSRHRNP